MIGPIAQFAVIVFEMKRSAAQTDKIVRENTRGLI
jgi:hypothetical protein